MVPPEIVFAREVIIWTTVVLVVIIYFGLSLMKAPQAVTQRRLPQSELDEAVLLGPVSAWVAEGEAQAIRDWQTKHPTPPPPRARQEWVTLYNPEIDGYHKVPDNPGVVADFATRGWIKL